MIDIPTEENILYQAARNLERTRHYFTIDYPITATLTSGVADIKITVPENARLEAIHHRGDLGVLIFLYSKPVVYEYTNVPTVGHYYHMFRQSDLNVTADFKAINTTQFEYEILDFITMVIVSVVEGVRFKAEPYCIFQIERT